MLGAPHTHGFPLAQKACAKVCPFFHCRVARLALSIPLSEHNGTALVVQSSLSCRMTHFLCFGHIRSSFLAASFPTTNSPLRADSRQPCGSSRADLTHKTDNRRARSAPEVRRGCPSHRSKIASSPPLTQPDFIGPTTGAGPWPPAPVKVVQRK